jgi:hypothetical protein
MITIKDLKVMIENGVSIEAIHQIHGDLIQCPIDQKKAIETALNNQGMKLKEDGTTYYK